MDGCVIAKVLNSRLAARTLTEGGGGGGTHGNHHHVVRDDFQWSVLQFLGQRCF